MIRNGIIDAAVVGGGEEQSHAPGIFWNSPRWAPSTACQDGSDPPARLPVPSTRNETGWVLGGRRRDDRIEREKPGPCQRRTPPCHHHRHGRKQTATWAWWSRSAPPRSFAIRASFQGLPYGPDAVDLVECHATSTRQRGRGRGSRPENVLRTLQTHRAQLFQIPDRPYAGRCGHQQT